ncbi:CLUMA_CG021030, isoform A [Clunio marinus]|uniref:CLUMA_CG021030, isoform A n=1 Tax=Clunio marinus TaxID=568069 RepID=A0A1J1J649_9DIPT|nr:CLUMA_CG021030, isoform A [Clunio marinus]
MTFILLNCTNIYNRVLIEKIVLYNNSEMLEYWAHPPVDIIIKVHVFNYTNIFQVLNGTEKKIKLDEVGPYVYREHIEKTQLVFEDNKITFNENRSHIFLPELSGNFREDDVVIVPNLPLVSGIPNVKSLGFFAEIGFKTILAATKPREFHNLTISKYFMGYNDDFMNVISKIKWDFNPNDVGILAPRRGMTKKNITVFSGTTDVNTVGETFALGGKTMLDVWKTKDCNKVGGSDGVIYGPKSVQNKENLQVYLPEFCRSLPLVFNKEERTEEGYRAYRYIAPQGSFSTSKPHLENEFYCELKNTKEKQIDGVLDVSGCIDGTPPIFISHPHFMEGSEELFSNFEDFQSLYMEYQGCN